MEIESIGAGARRSAIYQLADLVEGPITAGIAVRVTGTVSGLGSIRLGAGDPLDSRPEPGIQILESVDMEGSVLASGDLFQFAVQNMVGDSYSEQLDILTAGIVGGNGHIVLASSVGDDDTDPADTVMLGPGTAALAKGLGSDVFNGGAGSRQPGEVVNPPDGFVKCSAVFVVTKTEFMSKIGRIYGEKREKCTGSGQNTVPRRRESFRGQCRRVQ